jgi:GNAT superfamily N-acetyltransferase
MKGAYRVAPAAPEHLCSLPQIERSAASLFGDAVPAQLLETVAAPSVFAAAQRDGLLWVAVGPGGEPVGFARVESAGRRAHLAELDVLPAHGRRGVGTALVQTVESWAVANGFSELTLTTYREFPWNEPFYAGLGFDVVSQSDLDRELMQRFDQEAGMSSERARRVAMRKGLRTVQQRHRADGVR